MTLASGAPCLKPSRCSDSMMTHCADPHDGLELLVLRERMREWRFYDHLRTDRDAPARRPQIGTHTPVLASDGADLAAAIRTIMEIGNPNDLGDTIADAFPGGGLSVTVADGYFELTAWSAEPIEGLRVVGRNAALSSSGRSAAIAETA